MAGTKKATTDEGYGAYCLGTLGLSQIFKVATIGAGEVNTVVVDSYVLPVRAKISAVAIYCTAIDSIAGTDAFNIVVGPGAYSQGVVVANDNQQMFAYNQASTASGVANSLVGGGSGITTNFALPGQALFAADVVINAVNTPGILVATGGSAVFGDIPTALSPVVLAGSDAVFERGQVLTLRFVTTATTGLVTNFQVVVTIEPRPLNSPSHTEPQFQWNGPTALNAPQASGPSLVNVRPTSGYTF